APTPKRARRCWTTAWGLARQASPARTRAGASSGSSGTISTSQSRPSGSRKRIGKRPHDMPAVASGDLRHKVQLQENQITQDPTTGEMVPSWVTVASVWAQVVPMSGREFLAASAEQSEVRGRITIRYREDVDAAMRVVY